MIQSFEVTSRICLSCTLICLLSSHKGSSAWAVPGFACWDCQRCDPAGFASVGRCTARQGQGSNSHATSTPWTEPPLSSLPSRPAHPPCLYHSLCLSLSVCQSACLPPLLLYWQVMSCWCRLFSLLWSVQKKCPVTDRKQSSLMTRIATDKTERF